MKVGDEFSSFVELEVALRLYEDETATNFIKAVSRTIEGARKKGLKRYIDPKLEYKEIDYVCIKSGKFRSQSKGIRPKQNSHRSECPVRLRIRASEDGTKLVVKSFMMLHNHVISKDIYARLPRQRRLNPETKQMAAKVLKLKANKLLLQQELMKEHNVIVTMKDIHNLAQPKKTSLLGRENDLVTMHKKIVSKYRTQRGMKVEAIQDADGTLKGLLFQDKEMRKIFALCPEITYVATVSKLNKCQKSAYVFLVEECNGLVEMVGICLLTSNYWDDISRVTNLFKQHNPAWRNVKTLTVENDLAEKKALETEFPSAKMVTLLPQTNDHVEFIRLKLARLVTRISNLERLFEELQNFLVTLRTERDRAAAKIFSEQLPTVSNLSVIDKQFYWLLTPFAFRRVYEELKLRHTVEIPTNQAVANGGVLAPDNTTIVKSSSGNFESGTNKCTCPLASNMRLPCRHTFKLREMCSLPLFCPELCAKRWTRECYHEVCKYGLRKEVASSYEAADYENIDKRQDRYNLIISDAEKMATLASQATGPKFMKIRDFFRKVTTMLEQDKDLGDPINWTQQCTVASNGASETECNMAIDPQDFLEVVISSDATV